VERKHDHRWHWGAVRVPLPRQQRPGNATCKTTHHRSKPEISNNKTGYEHGKPKAPGSGRIEAKPSADNRNADE
jgi:hypothetical protein